MFDGNFRTGFEKIVQPVGVALQRVGISPNFITGMGVVMAAGCGAAIGTGRFGLAVFMLAMTGLPDALDGAVAKAGGTAGPRGAFLDSTSDRLSDGLLFAGAGWYYAGTGNPRMAMLPFALYISASLVSYQRAKAESLGFEAKGGLMERAERFIALGIGLFFAALFSATVLTVTLWIMLALTTATAIYRFIKIWRQASGQPAIDTSQLARARARRREARQDQSLRARTKERSAARARRRN